MTDDEARIWAAVFAVENREMANVHLGTRVDIINLAIFEADQTILALRRAAHYRGSVHLDDQLAGEEISGRRIDLSEDKQ